MKLRLNVKERLLILGLLPKENNYLTLKVIRNLQEALSFSEQELKRLDFKQTENMITWNEAEEKKLGDNEIEVGEKMFDLIEEQLKKLDNDKKLTNEHFSIYEKFCVKDKT